MSQTDEYPIIQVPEDAADLAEQLGTKPKFWYEVDRERWLFKEPYPSSGEDWSEKTAGELCSLLRLPHAHYELAEWRQKWGVVSPTFVPTDAALVHGNELIAHVIKKYPTQEFFRVSQHTLDIVLAVVGVDGVQSPHPFQAAPGLVRGVDVFVGYLMLDAWIGNQDRHHENWALVGMADGSIHLAPTYDHASSLGRNETDEKRLAKLKGTGQSMSAYVRRVRSAFFLNAGDAKPMTTLEAFRQAALKVPAAALAWLDRLENVEQDAIMDILGRIPSSRISQPGIDFALIILALNRERLLALGEELV